MEHLMKFDLPSVGEGDSVTNQSAVAEIENPAVLTDDTGHLPSCSLHPMNACFDEEVCTCSRLQSGVVSDDGDVVSLSDTFDVYKEEPPIDMLAYLNNQLSPQDGFCMDYESLSKLELANLLPPPLREDMLSYCELLTGEEQLASPFISFQESLREFKAGRSIEHHLLAMARDSRRSLISMCHQEQFRSKLRDSSQSKRTGARRALFRPPPPSPIDSARVKIIYIKRASRTDRPLTYECSSFRAWIHGEAAYVWGTTVLVPTLNHAAETLYGYNSLTAREAATLLLKAAVIPLSWSEIKTNNASANVLSRSLTCGPLVFESPSDLDVFPEIFTKNKPLYRFATKFLSSDDDFDIAKLAASLEKAFSGVDLVGAVQKLNMVRNLQAQVQLPFQFRSEDFPPLAGVKRQGNTMATDAAASLHASGHVHDLGSDFGRGLVDGVKSGISSHIPQLLTSALNSIIGITAMSLATTPLQFAVAVAQTVLNDPYAQSVIAKLTEVVRQGKDDVKPNWFSSMIGVAFLSSVKEFFGEVYSALLPKFSEICGALKFGSLKMLGESVAHWLADALQELFLRIKGCVKERSLQPLFGVDGMRWVRHSEGIKRYYTAIVALGDSKKFHTEGVQDQLPPLFRRHMTHSEFYEALETHIQDGQTLLPLVTPVVARSVSAMLQGMRNLLSDVGATLDRNATRLNPFCTLFFGQPGTGKTTDADVLASALARSEHRSDEDIYHYAAENFKTNLKCSTCVVRMDDPDSSVAAPSANAESYCDFIQHLASTNPYSVEQAHVDEKGKEFARPTDIVITTNFPHLHAIKHSTQPSAIWRRINIYIESYVKPKFATSGRLDPAKNPPPSGACLYNVYSFQDAGDSGQEFKLSLLHKNLEWKVLMGVLLQQRAQFIGRQRSLLAAKQEVCSECHFPRVGCVCLDAPIDFEAISNEEEIVDFSPKPPVKPQAHSKGLRRQGQIPSSETFHEHCRKVKDYFTNTSGLGVITAATALAGLVTGVVMLLKAFPQGRIAGTEVDSWFRADSFKEPAFPTQPPATWTKADLINICAHHRVDVKGSDGCRVQGVIYKPGWVLFPTHAFGPSGLAEVTYRGRTDKIRRDSSECRLLSNAELSVVYISALSGQNGIHVHMAQYPVNSSRMNDAVLCGERSYSFSHVTSRMQNGFPCWSYDLVTRDGDCGAALVAEGPGGAYRVYGIHMWASTGILGQGAWAGSVQVSADQVDAVIASAVPLRSLFTQGIHMSKITEMKHYPPKSEIGVATTFYNANVINYGTSGNRGVSLKTAFRKTSFHDRVLEFAHSQGVYADYSPPVLKGGMTEEGVYFSPFIHALRDTNNSNTTYDDVVEQYVQAVVGNYGGPISEMEALKGVPGEFNSINVRTSMGAPIYGPKTNHISPTREELSPVLSAHIDELEGILERGEVPIIVAEATLKDEVLKRGKPARVFCMLPAAFNIVCKRRFSVLKRALRSSYFASHNAVGMDLGSRQCEDVVQWMLQYSHIYGLDISRMDKCWTPHAWDSVAHAIKRIIECSAGEKIADQAYRLVLAMKECVLDVKGDLFCAFWNVSGNDITVELNSILLSLMILKVCKHVGVEPFFLNYGDDDILCTNSRLPDDFFLRFKDITGFDVTDDQKRSTPSESSLDSITFLKRTFRYEESIRAWMAPLALSSIVKMLLFRGRSPLSPGDHEAELLASAERYLLLHGKDIFLKWTSFLREIVEYTTCDYQRGLEQYRDGKFSDWMDRNVQHDGAPLLGVKMQGDRIDVMNTQDSSVPPSAVVSALSANQGEGEISTQVKTDASSDTVRVMVESESVVVSAPPAFMSSVGPPRFDLQNFPERWTKVRIIPLSSANVPVSSTSQGLVDTIPLTLNLLNNAELAAKMRHWTWWRGDIEVLGVLSAPGNASGCYVLSALPEYSDQLTRPDAWMGYDCLALDHTVMIHMSSSTSFTMTCPFFSVEDADSVNLPGDTGRWVLKLTCLSPLRTSIPGGVSLGNLTLYARLKTGYELLTPRWQGLRSRPSSVSWQGDSKKSQPRLVSTILSAAAGVAEALGYSRTAEQAVNNPVVMRSVQNVAQLSGTDFSDTAGFMPGNRISNSSRVLGNSLEDPLSFASMSARWSLIAGFDWTPSMTGGTLLKTIPVTPGFSAFSNTVSGVHFNTGAGYCGYPFQYWRADAEYLVVIPASSLHRGALQAVYCPNIASIPTVSDDVSNTAMNAMLEVSGASMYEIMVGYAQATPMASLAYLDEDTYYTSNNTDNGFLVLRVLNPLISQNPADTIRVQVFVRFHNVQFAVPRTIMRYNDDESEFVNSLERAVTLQGEVPGNSDDRKGPVKITLVPTAPPYPVSDMCSGEMVSSLRALAQKPSRLGIMTPGRRAVFAYGYGGLGRDALRTVPSLTMAALATAPFIVAASSENIKLIATDDTWAAAYVCVATSALWPKDLQNLPQSAPLTFMGANKGADFHLPYYHHKRGLRTVPTSDTLTPPLPGMQLPYERLAVIHVDSTSDVSQMAAYYSLGDDLRVGPFSRIPAFKFSLEEFPLWRVPFKGPMPP